MRHHFVDYELDTDGAVLYHAGQPIELQRRVLAVLIYLIEHQGRVVSKDELATQVWKGAIDNTTIESCIKKARRAVGDNGRQQQVIATRFGLGYVFVAPVVSLAHVAQRPLAAVTPAAARARTLLPSTSLPGSLPASREVLAQPQRPERPGREPGSAGVGRLPEPGRRHTALPLIGRGQELSWCRQALAEAQAGTPGVVLIEGEAGIGKTRLLTEVRSLAVQRGFQVYAGRCHEDLALPYLPFVRTIFADMGQASSALQPALHTEVEIMRRFLSRDEASAFTDQAVLLAQADQNKLRLFLAVTQVLIRLAQHQPVLLVLEDLHWADGSTLDLLSHLIFSVADTVEQTPVPLCIMATYRPAAATERLGRLLARFRGETICQMLQLPGLDEPDIAGLLQALDIRRPAHQLVTLVQGATQGNPLFIQEVAHQLLQQGALQEQRGRTVAAISLADIRLPSQITAALASRVQALEPACQHILTLAACLGEYVPFRVLQAISGMQELPLLDLLEESVRQGILVSEGQGFQFTHPLLRRVLYHTLHAVRRHHVHQQIAAVLEQLYPAQRERRVLEIAHHMIEAGPLAAPDAVLATTRQAGDQALLMFAWREAARYYEAALAVATDLLPLAEQAALHYRAGLAYHRDQDIGPCLEHYEQALAAYRLTDDVHGLAAVLMDQTETQFTLASLPLGVQADLQPLEEVLARLDEDAPGLRGRIYTVMSQVYRFGRQEAQAQAIAQRALALGQRLADDELCARASFALGLAYFPSLQIHQALDSWYNALAAARRIDHLQWQGSSLARIPLCLMLLGRLEEAEAVALEAYTLTRQLRAWGGGVSVALSHLASVSVARGNLAATERYAEETMQVMYRSGYPWGGFRALLALACAATMRGAWRDAEGALNRLAEPGTVFRDPGPVLQVFVTIFRHLVQAYQGTGEGPLTIQVPEVVSQIGTDSYALAPLCALVELADIMALPSLAVLPSRVLKRLAEQGACFSSGWIYLIPRVLGIAARLSQQWDEAETYFQRAVDIATRSGAGPELARTYLDYARLLLARRAPDAEQRARALLRSAKPLAHALNLWSYPPYVPLRTD